MRYRPSTTSSAVIRTSRVPIIGHLQIPDCGAARTIVESPDVRPAMCGAAAHTRARVPTSHRRPISDEECEIPKTASGCFAGQASRCRSSRPGSLAAPQLSRAGTTAPAPSWCSHAFRSRPGAHPRRLRRQPRRRDPISRERCLCRWHADLRAAGRSRLGGPREITGRLVTGRAGRTRHEQCAPANNPALRAGAPFQNDSLFRREEEMAPAAELLDGDQRVERRDRGARPIVAVRPIESSPSARSRWLNQRPSSLLPFTQRAR